MTLADLGADVIKVERPIRGDDTRGWGPPFDARGESAYYLSTNRNKLSLAADLTASADVALVRDLLLGADVAIDNFLPGTLQRCGLDVDALLRENERLVWCTITGFGEYSQRPGYDFVVQAEAGWMHITGTAEGEPMKTGVGLADALAGKDATIAILAALHRRDPALDRRRLHITLAASARAMLLNVAQNALVSGRDASRWGNAHANLVPYQLFQARDRAIVIAVGTDAQWQALIGVLRLEDLQHDAALSSNAGRLAHRERIVAAVAATLAERDAADWQRDLDAVHVPCGVVKTIKEAIDDALTASPLTGMPSSVGGTVRLPPPRLDEHGGVIRAEGWRAFARYRVVSASS